MSVRELDDRKRHARDSRQNDHRPFPWLLRGRRRLCNDGSNERADETNRAHGSGVGEGTVAAGTSGRGSCAGGAGRARAARHYSVSLCRNIKHTYAGLEVEDDEDELEVLEPPGVEAELEVLEPAGVLEVLEPGGEPEEAPLPMQLEEAGRTLRSIPL